MPRPPRIDFPDAVYHVTSRGNGCDVIFWSDEDRRRFLGQLADNLTYPGYADVRKAQEFVSYDVLKEYGRDESEARKGQKG